MNKAIWFSALSAFAAVTARAREPVDFVRDVQPILRDACFKCHGNDKQKAGLRLDRREDAMKGGKNGPVIVAGKSKQSALWLRLTTADADERMPKEADPLKPEQIAKIRAWIDSGAIWPDRAADLSKHWAYQKPVRPELPRVRKSKWPRNPIDYFILARLEREGLKPSPEAMRETLLRRVTLDLTGLPPTLEEVNAFLADPSAEAYERVVDRLLASPRYGERMVWEWLDAARYADTNGYQGDPTRTMWHWRDWVVEALNKNMPFDQFTIEQLAGDLLPHATIEQKIATGFHRNHMINGEGGRIAEESRVDYVQDRVETTGTVWLGLTLTCARCHDHKYDPISQREYYQLAAFFNSIDETGGADAGGMANPILLLPAPAELQAKIDAAKEAERDARNARNELERALKERQPQWEWSLLRGGATLAEAEWHVLAPEDFASEQGVTLTKLHDHSLRVSGLNPDTDDYVVTAVSRLVGITGIRLEALPDESLVNHGPGRADNGNFVLSEFVMLGDGKPIELAAVRADFEQSGWPLAAALDGKNETGWAVMPEFGKPHVAVFEVRTDFGYRPDRVLSFRLQFRSPHKRHTLGRFRLSVTNSPAALLRPMPDAVRAALAVTADQRSAEQAQAVTDFYLASEPRLLAARKRLEEAKSAREALEAQRPRTMVMRERRRPRETFILTRGIYDQPAEKVSHGTPAVLPPLPMGKTPTRLELARWLVSPDHPLTARVAVNRYWQLFFGTGLVKTSEDFGVRGDPPSHPELLDWLATEFVRSGWDVKAMHRLIVTSATYRQSSRVSPKLLSRDPENRLLARGPRYRLPSWMLRDQALALSGLLVEKIGGPPVRPYQPAGIWEEATFGTIKYEQDHGEALYRRSLYVFWRRIVGPTMFFDVSNRQVCTVKVDRTNTPLHALVLLNDITYVEAARKFAERVMTAATAPQERVALAFRLATARKPTVAEEKILLAGLARLRTQFAATPAEAAKLLSIGESPRMETLPPKELAAYTALCSLLLNLDEVMTKE